MPTPSPTRVVDLFAGPGGWSQSVRALGMEEVGLEWDPAACLTRKAAGHPTIRADVSQYPVAPFKRASYTGLIASPPCQEYSRANSRGKGRDSTRGKLVEQVLRWTRELEPEWVVCEQVPAALPIWQDYSGELFALGYSTWVGVLSAEEYGAPQTRRRAILIASRVKPVGRPAPTHPKPQTMAEALGATHTGGVLQPGSWADGRGGNRRLYSGDEPAPTLAFGNDSAAWKWVASDGTKVPVTAAEAGVLQGFPAAYPWQGTKTAQFQQIGNAIPVQLSEAVLREAS